MLACCNLGAVWVTIQQIVIAGVTVVLVKTVLVAAALGGDG